MNGKSIAFNVEFARQVLYLARHFDCSELYVAGLLHSVMTENPNIGPVGCVEATIVEFHQRRRHLADCLRILLAEALNAGAPNASTIHVRLEEFVRRELIPGYVVAGGGVPLAQEILNQIETISLSISKVQAERQNSGSDTVVPSSQGKRSFLFLHQSRSILTANFRYRLPRSRRPHRATRIAQIRASRVSHRLVLHCSARPRASQRDSADGRMALDQSEPPDDVLYPQRHPSRSRISRPGVPGWQVPHSARPRR